MPVNVGSVLLEAQYDGNNGTTTDATPLVLGRFAVPASTTVLASVRVIARVPGGATKCWRLTASAKRSATGDVSAEATQTPTAMASASDSTALSGCSIAMYSDATDLGVTVTGLAGTTIAWAVWIDAVMVTD